MPNDNPANKTNSPQKSTGISRREFLGKAATATAFAILPGMGATAQADAAGLPVLSDSSKPFSFAVLGDMHFSRPAYEARKIGANIAQAIEDVQPPAAFICQTGDLAHGEQPTGHKQLNAEEMKADLAFAVKTLTEQFRRPLFIAVGNHDKHGGDTPYSEIVLPFLSQELGTPVSRLYYAFRYGNSCFIFLDYGDYSEKGTRMDYAAQRKFLEETLAHAHALPGIRHVFAFGHYPLWPVIRPGFCNRHFTDSVVPVLKALPLDAYFCGHTHNTGAWVRQVDGVPITQIKGVAMDNSASLQPMDEKRTLLIPKSDLSYGWGYLSGPPNGFFLVSVDGARVRVQFRSGSTVLREFEWQEPGKITDTVKPAPPPHVTVSADDLKTVTAATLIFTAWTEEHADVNVVLNGAKIGQAQFEPMPQYAAFTTEIPVALPVETLKTLRPENSVSFENPGRRFFGIGNVRLEVRLTNGAVARSSVSERYFLSASKAEAIAMKKTTLGWDILPADITSIVPLGQPLGLVSLAFAP